MSTSHTQWTNVSTSQESKRKPVDTLAVQGETDRDEQQTELLARIQRAVEQERQRIAEDLHDSVAQDVALALYKLEHIQHLLEQSQLYQAFQEVTRTARILENGLQGLRNSISALLPEPLDKQTLFASLMTLIQDYQQDHPEVQIDCRVEPPELMTQISSHIPSQLPSKLQMPIFRFIQQALNNIWQHASATRIVISFVLTSNILTVEVRDNGNGFSLQSDQEKHLPLATDASENETPTQFGLRIMRKRIEHADGTWEIKSQPGGGTSVCASFSLRA